MAQFGYVGLDAGATQVEEPLKRSEALAMLASGEYRVMLRVESNNNEPGNRSGAYRNGAVDRCIYGILATDEFDLRTAHPVPFLDAGLAGHWDYLRNEGTYRNYLFGFSKFSQYKNWFFIEDGLKDEEAYSVLGVYIVPLEASHVGQFQMIAHRDEMTHLMDLPMTYKLDETLQELFDAQVTA